MTGVAGALLLAFSLVGQAQTNLQVQYGFGPDFRALTATLEGKYNDVIGSTSFYVDYVNPLSPNGPKGSYYELSRCFNLWQETALAPLSLQVEYNGGTLNRMGIRHAVLAGLDYFLHSNDYRFTLNLKALYKWIDYSDEVSQKYGFKSQIPMQFTAVWDMQDLFDLPGLRFCGYADFWWQHHLLTVDEKGVTMAQKDWQFSNVVFLSEPQLWYNLGQWIGLDNFNIGGEVELSFDMGSLRGFWIRPRAGIQWVF